MSNKFNIGDIVTLKSHPLLTRNYQMILEFPAQVPPLMLVKEIHFEDSKKKKIYHEDLGKDYKVADLIKYCCVYFNGNKSEFNEIFVYESFLNACIVIDENNKKIIKESSLKFYRIPNDKIESEEDLLDEVLNYKKLNVYNYCQVVQFKTKKLEQRKSFDSRSETINNTFQTPDFIVSGYKLEEQKDLFYHDGEPKKILPKELLKVTWFNHFGQKMSEKFLPKEFFVTDIDFSKIEPSKPKV
ncbi:hypothetical protein [Flavobacterium okayamense]|nr:hypothetical protein [Flavobacterium okayamense]